MEEIDGLGLLGQDAHDPVKPTRAPGLEKDRRGNFRGGSRTTQLLEADCLRHREAALAPDVDEACGPLRGHGRQQEVSLFAEKELPRRLEDPLAI